MSRFSSILEQNDVTQVFDLFETYQKNSIYVVGGSIRDALLNREITDIDFATSLEPKTITEILNKENIKFESYILIKDEDKNSCKICDSKFENENDK